MRNTVTTALIALSTFGLAACDVQQTEEGQMPDVDVSVDEGNMPEYDVDGPEITAGTTKRQVEVPNVDISTETETVDVPVIGIEPGDVDDDN